MPTTGRRPRARREGPTGCAGAVRVRRTSWESSSRAGSPRARQPLRAERPSGSKSEEVDRPGSGPGHRATRRGSVAAGRKRACDTFRCRSCLGGSSRRTRTHGRPVHPRTPRRSIRVAPFPRKRSPCFHPTPGRRTACKARTSSGRVGLLPCLVQPSEAARPLALRATLEMTESRPQRTGATAWIRLAQHASRSVALEARDLDLATWSIANRGAASAMAW